VNQNQPAVVRGRCACGKRYRIRNARPDITVVCPNCRRSIPVTLTDFRLANADVSLVPFQNESELMLEAIPVDHGALRMALEGGRPGLTGVEVLGHEEAALARARRGNLAVNLTYENLRPTSVGAPLVWAEFEPGPRAFVHDLVASFYLAGVPRNALNLLVAIAGYSLLLSGTFFMKQAPLLLILMIPLFFIVFLYMIQFFWAVLKLTANDEDVIRWTQDEWSFRRDCLAPLLWMCGISAMCTLPYYLLMRFSGLTLASDPTLPLLVLALGWFFWPAAVMSAALGGSIRFVRPDWLVRCVIGIGPVYLAAWLAVMLAVGGWYAFLRHWQVWLWIPVVGAAANLYFGYVLFRTLGLLFRHFRERFPWKC